MVLALPNSNSYKHDWENDCDWGLFIILDEEDNKQEVVKQNKMWQIETIEEGDCETDDCDDFYNGDYKYNGDYTGDYNGDYYKSQYYKNDRNVVHIHEKEKVDANGKQDQEVQEVQEVQEQEDSDYDAHILKQKMQFLITYALTTSFSIALIVLTFSI